MKLTLKEQTRLTVLNNLESGTTTPQKAAALLGLSLRQLCGLRTGYRAKGAAAVAHGNRGQLTLRHV